MTSGEITNKSRQKLTIVTIHNKKLLTKNIRVFYYIGQKKNFALIIKKQTHRNKQQIRGKASGFKKSCISNLSGALNPFTVIFLC